MDTIFALSSGALPAAIAVVRLSGPDALSAAHALAGSLPEPRRAGLRTLRDAAGDALDQALVLCFPGPNSATGEDLVELHLHGGRAVVRAVLGALAAVPELREAEAGEFTRRALAHGRIDLSAAEGLGDLLMAETETQRRLAMRSAEGAVRREVEGWAREALAIAAAVEAMLDHGDEDDVVAHVAGGDVLQHRAAVLAGAMEAIVAQPRVERVRDGLRVVLAGPPNAGKSTLFNVLVQREAAIVSPIAGTTRDRIEAAVAREGVAYVLIDTAGLATQTDDTIEAIGIDRARAAIDEADILLWMGDTSPPDHGAALWLGPRSDVEGREIGEGRLTVSAATGEGVEAVWAAIAKLAARLLPPSDTTALNRRQASLAERASHSLRRAADQDDLLLFAEELRSVRYSLDAITGRVGVEQMLDALFARFCIGK